MNMSEKYVRLCKMVHDKGILVKENEVFNHIQDQTIDHYQSTYFYNENHFNEFQKTGSVKGVRDVKTNKVWWDFDAENNLNKARKDTLTLIDRLIGYKIDPNNLGIFFSGNKGFNVILNLTKELNRKQVENVALKFARDLETFDTSLYDEVQILRVPGTKHQKSGYYKIPLTFEEIKTIKNNDLYQRASKPLSPKEADPVRHLIDLDDELFEVQEVKESFKLDLSEDFDLTTKPRGWKSSKWALAQGFFKKGEKHSSLMILAATLKGQGWDKTQTYRLCVDALEKSWKRYGNASFDKETEWDQLKSDLFNNIVEYVYSDKWNGGQYSEKEDLFLQKKAEELGIKELTTSDTVDIKGALRIYKDYAKNISKLTLKTGIEELDKKQRITVGMAFGIVASPGCGKTTLALTMLHSMSKAGELAILFSYDMYAPLIIQKIIQKHWAGDNIEEVFNKYEAGDEEFVDKVEELVTKEYPNVEFCFETGQTIEDIYKTIRDVEQKHGKKCKFIVIDYNELVISDVADPTQSSNKTAQSIRALAQKEQLCVLSLFQPSKVTGDPSSEIMSYRAAKGGSGIEQSLRLMLGVSRPGYDANHPENDKFLNLKVLKNNMGQIFAVDLHWDGYKGEIRSLNSNEKSELATLRKAKEDEKNGNNDEW